ncbi:hypothetical protein JX266_011769 [Neoarthrinium moseri]|nr:hypothetical protein JX266_011769 [Neoarthrinium moseri]
MLIPPAGPGQQEAQWPPRSPREALVSTPGGRERLRRLAERASPSPSPLKKSRSMSGLALRPDHMRTASYDDDDGNLNIGEDDDDAEDEDEETLRLKLQAIEAKLKLKALQKKQQKKAVSSSSDAENSLSSTSRPVSAAPDVLAASRAQSRAAMLAEGPRMRAQSQGDVQVPVSPVRRTQTVSEQRSPSRVLLGIDKGLKAKDVSLKRASSVRKPSETYEGQTGGYLRRAHTPASASQSFPPGVERPKTFSERLAAARNDEATREDRQARIRKVRSKAFEVGQDEVERYKSRAAEIPDIPQQAESFSREEVLAGARPRQNNTVPGGGVEQNTANALTQKTKVAPSEVTEDEATSFEPYSGFHLSKRILPHNLLTRTFSGRKILLIKDLLAQVKAPNFELPEVEQDIVVLAILADKSEPKTHNKPPGTEMKEKKSRFAEEEHRGKYMVTTIVDLTWQMELFLFNSAFNRYWKMTPGTVIAILNPTVMPPPKGREHTNRFSLVLNSDEDAVLELGNARDLGFCKSTKKDGSLCNSWVNKKRTEFCEFHMNLALGKHRLARQDINTGSGIGPYEKKSREKMARNKKDEERDRRNGKYDRETNSHFFVSQASAASLLDGEQTLGKVEKREALRRKLAHQEKEREIMKQLGSTGRAAGREYMNLTRAKLGSSMSSAADSEPGSSSLADQPAKPPDARSLGLLTPRDGSAARVHLSPVKRKRNLSAATSGTEGSVSGSSTAASGRVPLGWGGGLHDKLSRMKDGERLDGKAAAVREEKTSTAAALQPAKKKTRFVTDKGIREAGRESLGGELAKKEVLQLGLDSDDELEILM